MEASVEIAGREMIVEYVFDITSHGCPASGPTYYSGGEPAEPAEADLTVLSIRHVKDHPTDPTPELELPDWLKSLLETQLYERDDIATIIQRAADEDGPDPDLEYGAMRDEKP